MMATGAKVLGLYSHGAHLVDKEEGKIPQPFKGTKPKQTRGRGKHKGKPHEQRQNPPKAQEADEMYAYEVLTIIITMITTMPQVRVEAADLLLVMAVTDNLEISHNKTEAKDHNTANVSFRIIDIREVHPNKTILNTAITANPIFRKIKQITIEAKVMAVVLSIIGGTVVVGPTIRVVMEHTSISTHDSQPEQYGLPCSLCSSFNHSPKHCYKGEHDINNIMEKMSINPHQSQQSNLYQ